MCRGTLTSDLVTKTRLIIKDCLYRGSERVNVLAPYIAQLFNLLYDKACIPTCWKQANSAMVFTQVVILCNPCSFFGTYNMLHEQLNPMGRLGCTLLSLILNKPMTPFQGMHYGNTLGALACLRLCSL